MFTEYFNLVLGDLEDVSVSLNLEGGKTRMMLKL